MNCGRSRRTAAKPDGPWQNDMVIIDAVMRLLSARERIAPKKKESRSLIKNIKLETTSEDLTRTQR